MNERKTQIFYKNTRRRFEAGYKAVCLLGQMHKSLVQTWQPVMSYQLIKTVNVTIRTLWTKAKT